MDDFSISSLTESKNEWCARLLNILSPTVFQGLKSIFDESWKLCIENNEKDKYLMTFQNFLTRVPKWNQTIIDTEKARIIEKSGCTYLEELITCVHVIQLKALTCVRVGSKQKKVDIDVPSVSSFIHKIYIHVARKIYTNIYLFETGIAPLSIQKNNRDIENIIKECILNAIRDSIPVENILRAYMDETEEQDVIVKEVEEPIPDEVVDPNKKTEVIASAPATVQVSDTKTNEVISIPTPTATATSTIIDEIKNTNTKLSFSNDDILVDDSGNKSTINSPKDVKSLEDLNNSRVSMYDEDDDDDDDEENDKLSIGDNVKLDITDINDLNKSTIDLKEPILLDFEVLT